MPKKSPFPRYCLHKPTGLAYVRVNGKQKYLGKHGCDESLEEYRRIIAKIRADQDAKVVHDSGSEYLITVAEVILKYLKFAEKRYAQSHPQNFEKVRLVARFVRQRHGRELAAEFGSKKLKGLRDEMIDMGLARKTINERVGWIKRLFRWAVSEEELPTKVNESLRSVDNLVRGEAKEGRKVPPVADEVIDATLPFLPPVVADMVPLQRLTGVRPGELFIMRPCDVERSNQVWKYTPESRKTDHHGKIRVIFLGPKAQAILRPYLLRDSEAYCFSPAESERKRREELHAKRKTPLSCGNRPGKGRMPKTKRRVRDQYDKDSYRRAVTRAAAKAGVEHWTPYQLRHSTATAVRDQFGLDAVQVVLGHANAKTSEIYAQVDEQKARAVMSRIG